MLFLMLFAAGLPVMFVLMPAGVVIGAAMSEDAPNRHVAGNIVIMLITCCVAWVGWATIFRGGVSYWLTGISLRRRDGRKAGRLQCAVRALLPTVPVALFYFAAITIATSAPEWSWLYLSIWAIGTLLLPLHFVLALINPTRSLNDRMVGTYMVPR